MGFVKTPIVRTIAVLLMVVAITPAFGGPKHGSCDSVAKSSICIDYSGSYWKGKQKEMRLNCTGPKSKFRPEHCHIDVPYGKYLIGSCIYGMETAHETISHHYKIGGGGYDSPDFNPDHLRISCQRVGGTWVWGRGSGRGIHGTP